MELGAGQATAGRVACFARFADAIAHATGGRARLARDAKPRALTERLLGQGTKAGRVGPSSSEQTVLGIAYQDGNYDGETFVMWTSRPDGCRSLVRPTTINFSTLVPSGWNDKFSSAKTFAGCRSIYYEHTSFRGATLDCNDCTGFGIMNERASSVRFYRP